MIYGTRWTTYSPPVPTCPDGYEADGWEDDAPDLTRDDEEFYAELNKPEGYGDE